jgi:hypothetical protein
MPLWPVELLEIALGDLTNRDRDECERRPVFLGLYAFRNHRHVPHAVRRSRGRCHPPPVAIWSCW